MLVQRNITSTETNLDLLINITPKDILIVKCMVLRYQVRISGKKGISPNKDTNKMKTKPWTREELILAINLYCKIPFGKIDQSNLEIINLAKIINRSPSAVSWKLANFAHLDPSLHERDISGASHVSKLDIEIWEEFTHDWEKLVYESEKLLAQKLRMHVEEVADIDTANFPKSGKEREATVKIRVNQSFFRRSVLAAYENRCCITGIDNIELLNASHIVPWSVDKDNRVNPCNGICLNVLHDRAFDRGLITITTERKIIVSAILKRNINNATIRDMFIRFDGYEIEMPSKFMPDPKFLIYHNEHIFRENA